MTFTYQEMVRGLAKPGADILATLTPEKAHLLHMAVGISGEAAELLDGDFNYFRVMGYGTKEQVSAEIESKELFQNIVEELGDLEFYIEGLLQGVGFEYSDLPTLPALKLISYDGAEAIAVIIHSGNVLDLVKKHVIYNKPLDKEAVIVEIAKLARYMDFIGKKHSITREQALAANRLKLGVRYQNGYSDKAAQERADKATV